MKGIITQVNAVKGFGYLKDEANDEYCFFPDGVHADSGTVQIGDKVSFEINRGRGTKAVNIRK